MKKRILALSLAVATVITVLAVGIFATNILRSSNTQPTDAATGPVIVAGYTDGSNITIGRKWMGLSQGYVILDSGENWVLPGRLVDGGNVTGTFGAQWDGTNLYLAIQGCNALSDITLRLGDGDAEAFKASTLSASDAKLADNIAELKVGISQFDPDAINNKSISIQISLSSGGSFSGKLKLSSVQWQKTTNVSNTITPDDIISKPMRGLTISGTTNYGGDSSSNGLHLYDRFVAGTESKTEYMGLNTTAIYLWKENETIFNRAQTSYISFDFKANNMPVYTLAEAVGGYHYEHIPLNFGFTWTIGDTEDADRVSNVTRGGIVNTEDDLYLIVAGDDIGTLKLNKKVGDTFNVGLAWHKNGDLTVYIDGVEQGYYTNKCTRMNATMHYGGIFLRCWRNETDLRREGDDFDLYINNMAFGYGMPEIPVRVLTAEDIKGENASGEEITGNLDLPVGFTWVSSNDEVIKNDGEVTQPASGAVKVTMTATDNADNKKDIDVIVLGTNNTNENVKVVEGDITPATGEGVTYSGKILHFDSNNNSIVYDQGETKAANVIKLTDLDEVSRLNRESISIWTSNDNKTYTRVEDNYKLLHLGKDWYLYNFTANARYIKVNYTLWDAEESDFANALSDIISVYYEDIFGDEGKTFEKTSFEITNNTGKKQQDYVWCIPRSSLNSIPLSNLRVMLDGEYLYHYEDGDNLYVRIPELENYASVTLTILYGNNSALDISDKESAYEVTYGTRETYMDQTQRFLFLLEAGTQLRNGTELAQDILIRNYGQSFYYSYDGGITWLKGNEGLSFNFPVDKFPVGDATHSNFGALAHGGYAYYEGRLFWSAVARQVVYESEEDKNINKQSSYNYAKYITYSDDGGKTWVDAIRIESPDVVGESGNEPNSYANGIVPSTADGTGKNIDIIFPVAVINANDRFVALFFVTRDGGETWDYTDALYMESEQGDEGGLTEATILENESGELVWYCRYQTNKTCTFATSVSKDGGETWSEPKLSTVFGSNTQPIIEKIDGDPFFVWGGNNAFGGHSYNRMPLNVAVSYDGLKTFRNIQNVYVETFLENYSQAYQCAYITNPSMVKSGKDLIIAYYTNHPNYRVFTRITDYENWFYRTKGIYDSFDSQNTKYEGWIPYMGETSLKREDNDNYALEILPHSAISRSVPYLQNGTVSLNVWVDGTSTFTVELQSAYTPVMEKAAPVSLEVRGTALYANGQATGLTLESGKPNSITINLGLAKDEPTASVCVGDGSPVSFTPNVEVMNNDRITPIPTDYVCYIAVNTGDASVLVDEVLVQSNLDAINYTREIKEVDVAISTQPTSQDKGVGEPATFSVEAQGYGLMYQWYVNSGNGWETIVGATSASYTTGILTDSHNGYQYKCIVMDRNENEAHSDVATLTVDYISVSIDWGTLQFICDENNAWRAVEKGADTITITNTSDVDMHASVTYQPVGGYDAIIGRFDEDEDPETASENLVAENGTVTWTLKLSSEGEANQDLDSTPIGTVTLRIQKATNNP